MSNLRWCIYRRAVLTLMKEVGLTDLCIAEIDLSLMPDDEKMRRLKTAAAEEGEPTYFD